MANPRHLEKPKVSAQIVQLKLEGLSDSAVARALTTKRVSVSQQGITAFLRRHPDLLKPGTAAMVEAAEEVAIANKLNRLADLQLVRDLAIGILKARGLEAKDTKIAGNGETVEVTYTDKALADVLLKALDDAAAEMGERGKGNNAHGKATLELESPAGERITFTLELGTDDDSSSE